MAEFPDIGETLDDLELLLSNLEGGEAMTVEHLQSKLSAHVADLRLAHDSLKAEADAADTSSEENK